MNVKELREITGVGLLMCKNAIDYAKGNKKIAIAYIKAKTFAVATPNLTFDERVLMFIDNKNSTSEIIKEEKNEYVLRNKITKEFFKIFRWDSTETKTVLDFTKNIKEALKFNDIKFLEHPHISLEDFEVLKLKTVTKFELIDLTN